MRISSFVILLGLVACGEESPAKDAPDSIPEMVNTSVDTAPNSAKAGLPMQPAALWIYPGGEGPKMRLSFEPDGHARFSGGFKWFNPVRWSYDSSAQVLTLRLNGIVKDDSLVFDDAVARGYALGFNRANSALMLRLGSETTVLDIAGYNFERQPPPDPALPAGAK